MATTIAYIRRHPVPAYYVLVFAISLGGSLVAIGPGGILGITPVSGAQLPFVYLGSLANPGLAGILLTSLVPWKSGPTRLAIPVISVAGWCSLDALDIRRAAVVGASAGAPSALQMAPQAATHIARDPVIKTVLATPSELLNSASPRERLRINDMIDHILPVSARAAGLISDTAVGKHLTPSALQTLRAPTLVFSARDDR